MDLRAVLHLLATAALIGMSAAAIPPIVRALPPFAGWTQQGIKPWACDLCMSFWSTVIASLVWVGLGAPWPGSLAAFVVTFAITRHNSEPIGLPPGFPELQDSGADVVDGRASEVPTLKESLR